jgi:hypothetical protein
MNPCFDDRVICEIGQSHFLMIAVDAFVGQYDCDVEIAAPGSRASRPAAEDDEPLEPFAIGATDGIREQPERGCRVFRNAFPPCSSHGQLPAVIAAVSAYTTILRKLHINPWNFRRLVVLSRPFMHDAKDKRGFAIHRQIAAMVWVHLRPKPPALYAGIRLFCGQTS